MANKSIKSFFRIFDYMEDIWLHVLNRMDKNELGFVRVECKNYEYIDLKLIEYHMLVELWAA